MDDILLSAFDKSGRRQTTGSMIHFLENLSKKQDRPLSYLWSIS